MFRGSKGTNSARAFLNRRGTDERKNAGTLCNHVAITHCIYLGYGREGRELLGQR